MKFIDLFAGLGGFHHGINKAGGFECVFASELDADLQELYQANYDKKIHGDITKIHQDLIPKHDLLCAGFPCQPFSLAGAQKGTECPESGKLIDDIARIAKKHRPSYIMLENVPNVLTIAKGSFWAYINSEFSALGYTLLHKVISPSDIGIPQNRKRLFILGFLNKDDAAKFCWPEFSETQSLDNILDNKLPYRRVENRKKKQLNMWQDMLHECDFPIPIPALSISAQEFGANYPSDFSKMTLRELRNYRGAYGQQLSDCRTWKDLLSRMPSYCRKAKKVPEWLCQSIQYSRFLYVQNKNFLDQWIIDLDKKNNSWQTLEWRGLKTSKDFKDHLLQFRASGIRVSKRVVAPSLIAMTPTQIPIIGSDMRYMSKYEAAKLQCLHGLRYVPNDEIRAFKAFGNAVNAKIVELIASNIKLLRN